MSHGVTSLLTTRRLLWVNVWQVLWPRNWKRVTEDLQNSNMRFLNDYVNIVSNATFWWMNFIFIKGYEKPLEQDDLGDIPERHRANFNHRKFKEAFDREKARAEKKGTRPSMFRIYFDAYWSVMLVSALLKIAADVLNLVGPLCIGALTSYVVTLSYPADSELLPPHYVTFSDFFANGFVLIVTMFVVLSIRVCIMNAHFKLSFMLSADIRAAIQSMIYTKALRLATFATTGGQMTMGQITNHMSADATNVMTMIQSMHFLWSAPFQIAIILIFLYFEIGFSALLGAALFIVVLPIQFKVAAIMVDKQKAILRCSDKRLKLTNELLQGIKLLKMYAWEELYSKAIEVVRKEEIRNLLYINLCLITSVSFTFGVPVLVTLVAFITFEPLSGQPLTPDITFSSLSLFNLIAIPLLVMPASVSSVVGSFVSSKRIIKFLLAPEVKGDRALPMDTEGKVQCKEKKGYSDSSRVVFRKLDEALSEPTVSIGAQADDSDDQSDDTERALMLSSISLSRGKDLPDASTSNSDQGIAIKITGGNFAWDPESTSPTLSDVNVQIPAGKLTMVIGAVGSGKSSLLASILNEMTTISGNVYINGEKGRIAFAAQRPWLMNASLRDNILFSSKMDNKRYHGVLGACALLPDIDILPAGDKTEIGEKGINLSGGQKQRVSVARAVYADSDIVILDDPLSALDVHVGRQLFEEGIMKQLVNNNKTVILVTHQLQYLSRADLILEMKDGTIAASGSLNDIIKADPEMYEEIKQVSAAGWDNDQAESAEEERSKLKRNVSLTSAEIAKGDGQLIEKEEMVRGSVSYKTYLYLLGSVGWGLILLVGVVGALQTSLSVTTNFWLSEWSEAGLSNETARTYTEYLVGYACLSVAAALSQALSTAIMILSFMVAAKRLHLRMLRNIIRAPMRFFDTTLVGQILNRFSNDIQMMDFRLPDTYNFFVISIMQIIASVVVVGVVMPIFLVFVIPIAIVYYILQRFYLATSRELQRLESISKSPVFAYFSESLGGLTTIRAYRCENRFYNTILARIDRNTAAFLYVQIGARWLAVRLDALGVLFVLLSTGSTLIGALSFGINPSLVGLSSAYSLQMSNFLNYLMRGRTQVEMQMNAVERIQFYSEVDREDYSGAEPSAGWPHSGEIRIDNVSVRYAEDLEGVLRNVSVYLKSGEKVGICGRTGSGKSSLTLALLRIIDIFEGQIFIDGMNIMSVPLTTLRSKISIIPQDPVLFTGPIRTNLDPERNVSDDEMWHALEIAQLKDVVSQLDGGLDAVVNEGGENFSVGQRQLFCLARAFLRKSRILIMDEATASVDMETDKTLQTVVATAFADRTVLTIAHRIATIRDADKIIVLDGGRMVEFGSPEELLADEDGFFTSLVGDD
ncbi:ATP-binding cassette sub-family C member 9-like isoform X2 [Acanthaster planci]|uniref:ATP-binding cassette sub-family C member 9-like isoform X2 n=1 Tax=Acanthaster planci TaxID=133434 RepID=A0A8B7ZGE0_ACAPL|nr:ATP-binding cassette sub-family C member 9-like isoform X2 [Acanthaster planci]